MSQAGVVNDAALVLPGNVATTFVTSSGTAAPSGNILNVLGATGSGNTVTVFAPNAILSVYDDFITDGIGTTNGQLLWRGNDMVPVNGTAGHPGVLGVNTNSGFADLTFIQQGATDTYPVVLGGGAISVNWVISLATLSTAGNRYTAYFGMMDARAAVPDNGVFFTYSDNVNSGNWVLNCKSATVTTSVNTSTPAVIGYVNFGIVINASATSVSFTINGSTVGTAITTNIPTLPISPGVRWNIAATSPGSLIDLFYMQQVLTTPR